MSPKLLASQAHSFESVYSLNMFAPGLAFDTSNAPQNSLNLRRSIGFSITPEGRISPNLGFVPRSFAYSTDSVDYSLARIRQIYWWERSLGGGTMLAAGCIHADSPGGLYTFSSRGVASDPRDVTSDVGGTVRAVPADEWVNPSGVSAGVLWPKKVIESGIGDTPPELECRDRNAFIDFVPFGDSCFIFDGRNQPLLMRNTFSLMPSVIPLVGGGVLAHVVDGARIEALEPGAYTYAFVPVLGTLGKAPVGYHTPGKEVSFLSVSVKVKKWSSDGRGIYVSGTMASSYLRPTLSAGATGKGVGGIVTLSNLSAYFEAVPSATEIQIYRTQHNTPELHLYVGSVFSGEDSFVDATPDSQLGGALDLRAGPPPIARLGATYQDRLWTIGDIGAGLPNLIRFSERFAPTRFPGDYFLYDLQLMQDDKIIRVVPMAGGLFIFTQNAIYRVVGSTPSDFTLAPITQSVGCLAARTLTQWREGVVFLSGDGPVFFDGTSVTNLSGSMQKYFREHLKSHVGLDHAVGVATKDYYHICLHDDTYEYDSLTDPSEVASMMLSLNLTNGAWGASRLLSIQSACQTSDGRALVARDAYQHTYGGGIYEILEDCVWGWDVGNSTAADKGLSLDRSQSMGKECQLVWDNIACDNETEKKVLNRIEIVYTGGAPDMWGGTVWSDIVSEGSGYEFTATSQPAWQADGAYILWNSFSDGTDIGLEREKHVQSIDIAGSDQNIYGNRFSLKLRPEYDDGTVKTLLAWAEIYEIRFFYTSEDIHA